MKTLLARFGLLSLAGASALAFGCAAERDPISRVQPNALPKSFFVGERLDAPDDDPEFRMESFIIDSSTNQSSYWPYESRAPYGGVGANPPDPLTGQTFGATATIMGRSATYAAGQQRDIVQLALGDLSMDDVIQGVPAERYAAALKSGAVAPAGLSAGRSPAEVAARTGAVDLRRLRAETGLSPLPGATALERGLADTRRKAKSGPDASAYAASLRELDAVASRLRGSTLEAQLADGRWMLGALGTSPHAAPTAEMLELASPLRGLDPAHVDAMHQWFQEHMASRGACFHDSTLAGAGSVYQPSLAGFFKAKYGDLDPKARGERIYEDLWREAVKGIGLHELGHSLGLRHNFASSWDSPNYNPQYWQLRTAEGKATKECKGPRQGAADSCMGPRYLDPMTDDEQGSPASRVPASTTSPTPRRWSTSSSASARRSASAPTTCTR